MKSKNKINNKNAITNKTKCIEWSKLFAGLVAFLVGIYGIWCGIEYYTLCKVAIESGTDMPEADLAVTCVTVVLASLLSYCFYQGALKLSLNKNKLTVDKVSGIVRSINECDFLDAVDKSIEDTDK